MQKRYLILIQVALSLLLISSVSFAAPNINDGFMSYTSNDDWGGLGTTNFTSSGFNGNTALTNVSVEEGDDHGGEDYDVEELGLYIDDNMLYIGMQTNFDLKSGQNGISPGDFIFNFDESSSTFAADNEDTDDFAFKFSINNDNSVDLTLVTGGLQESHTTDVQNFPDSYGPGFTGNYGKAWQLNETSTTLSQKFTNAGLYTYGNNGGENYYYNGSNTIEAAVNLNQLSGELSNIFKNYTNTSVTMFWQPSCGNDFLAARSDFSYTPNSPGSPVPEPATILLFGMGLLGAGALGRKQINKSNKKTQAQA